MRSAVILATLLGAATVEAAHCSTPTPTLQQPTCDDTQPRALSIFHLSVQSHNCILALQAYSADIHAATISHQRLVSQIHDFESNYDRLCRWQRLKSPPPMTCKHAEHFQKLRVRFDGVGPADRQLRIGFESVVSVCALEQVLDDQLGEDETRDWMWPKVDCAEGREKARREMR